MPNLLDTRYTSAAPTMKVEGSQPLEMRTLSRDRLWQTKLRVLTLVKTPSTIDRCKILSANKLRESPKCKILLSLRSQPMQLRAGPNRRVSLYKLGAIMHSKVSGYPLTKGLTQEIPVWRSAIRISYNRHRRTLRELWQGWCSTLRIRTFQRLTIACQSNRCSPRIASNRSNKLRYSASRRPPGKLSTI